MSDKLRDGTFTEDPRLDRIRWFDSRSEAYPIRTLVPRGLRGKTWSIPGVVLDQGQEGACVGFGVTNELRAYPKRVGGTSNLTARELYHEAQRIDPWPGGSYPGADPQYEGTAVLAGVKVAQRRGLYSEYRWAFGIDDLLRAVAWEGPVIIGVDWYEGMSNPHSNGFIEPLGNLMGGHCCLVRAISLKHPVGEPVLRIRNSWGIDWGSAGDCYITATNLEKLLKEGGEACIPMGRVKEPQVP